MSTNVKNRLSTAYFRNFTTLVERRIIMLDRKLGASATFEQRVHHLTEEINKSIQVLNLRVRDRQIPYVSLSIDYGDIVERDTRIYVHNWDTPATAENTIKRQLEDNTMLSHILDILVAHSYKIIQDSAIFCDAEIVVDDNLIESAVADVLLDIAMFNSFSFLKRMSDNEKKLFSKKKLAFYKENNLSCYYECKYDEILYYSFAFSARRSETEIDLERYISIWNEFLRINYPQHVHIENQVKEQLKYHVDYEELPQKIHQKFYKLDAGSYLLLRTNKDRTTEIHDAICALFGISSIKKGKVRIIPIEDYEKYVDLMKNLDVSAFKVVNNPSLHRGRGQNSL